MKYLSAILLCLISTVAISGNIVVEGNYQGKNLYVRNPFAGSGVGFCTFEVTVNGSVTTDEWNSSAFEVDLTTHNLDIGDRVVVVIKHKDDCGVGPKVLNPEVLNPRSTFEIQSIEINDQGVLNWKTTGETGVLTFIVEQFRWNKWVYVGEVEGKGISKTPNSYSFQVTPHSGENKFRVKQVDYTGEPNQSKPVTYTSSVSPIDFNPRKVEDVITFTGETMFEVYDIHGNIVKKGYSNKIDATNLSKGLYYLNYDNKTEEFLKKR